ncbi:hypothetical protein D3C87_689440 [compost metagenome]
MRSMVEGARSGPALEVLGTWPKRTEDGDRGRPLHRCAVPLPRFTREDQGERQRQTTITVPSSSLAPALPSTRSVAACKARLSHSTSGGAPGRMRSPASRTTSL